MDENFAIQLIEKQLRRSEWHFYAVCFLFFVFMLFAFLWPVASDIDTNQEVSGWDNVSVSNEVK